VFSESNLEEWRANGLTEEIIGVLKKTAELHKSLMQDAWFNGHEIDPEEKGKVKAMFSMVDDLENASADDWNKMKEAMNEHQANRI